MKWNTKYPTVKELIQKIGNMEDICQQLVHVEVETWVGIRSTAGFPFCISMQVLQYPAVESKWITQLQEPRCPRPLAFAKNYIFRFIYFFMCMSASLVYMSVCHLNVVPTEARRGSSNPLDLELQLVVSCQVDPGNQTWISEKVASGGNTEPFLEPLAFAIFYRIWKIFLNECLLLYILHPGDNVKRLNYWLFL